MQQERADIEPWRCFHLFWTSSTLPNYNEGGESSIGFKVLVEIATHPLCSIQNLIGKFDERVYYIQIFQLSPAFSPLGSNFD